MQKIAGLIRTAYYNREARRSILSAVALMSAKSGENGEIRWKVYAASSVEVYDLTNAGKRGKSVDYFLISANRVHDPEALAKLDKFVKKIQKPGVDYSRAYSLAKSLAESSPEFKIYEGVRKGVEVAPAWFRPFFADWDHVIVTADYDTFTIVDKDDDINKPMCSPALKGGKRSVKVFYRWVQDNERKLRKMRFTDILRAMSEEGIKYHEYCAN